MNDSDCTVVHFFMCLITGVDDLDFTRYPDKAYQSVWLRYYLEQKAIDEGLSPNTVTDTDVEACYVKTNKCAIVRVMI